MRKLLLTVLVAAIGFLPIAARADELRIIPVQLPTPPGGEPGIDPAKVIAVGAGIVIGATVFSSLLSFRGATLLGAVAGGMIGNWWYGDRSDIASLAPRKLP
jgi:hypothetical protein